MIIGITGKSGSGKTTFSKKLSQRMHLPFVEFDEIVHLSINEYKKETISIFGNSILNNNGEIDRKLLGDLIFSKRNEYKEYSETIYYLSLEKIKSFFSTGMVFDHILLPHLSEIWSKCDLKILLEADAPIRHDRILKRDTISQEYLQMRESASINYNPEDFHFVFNTSEGTTICCIV